MEDKIKIIHTWIKNLITKGPIPDEMIDPHFSMEDGMNLLQYWEYEKNSFDSFSSIFDLNQNFSIKINYVWKLPNQKELYFIYIINYLNKIVFKMSITLSENNLISSNHFKAQIVPKYVIENEKIIALGMALKTCEPLEDILTPHCEKIFLHAGSNFSEDGFYNARFCYTEAFKNKALTFYLKFHNNSKLEKRVVFFDNFEKNLVPYMITDRELKIVNTHYPVNLAVYYRDGKMDNFVYPRNISIDKNKIEKAIITDVLDNDWIVSVN